MDSLSKKLSVLQKSITTKDTEIIELEQKLEDANRSVKNLQGVVWFIYNEILTEKPGDRLTYDVYVIIVLYRTAGLWQVDFQSPFQQRKFNFRTWFFLFLILDKWKVVGMTVS